MSRRRGRATAVTVSRRFTGTKGERHDRYNYREMFRKTGLTNETIPPSFGCGILS
jgi:hypothetical protein